jgi:Mn2+/Fe2+ NRAMP family transporter
LIALAVLRVVVGIPLNLAAVGGIAIGTGLSFVIGGIIGYGVGYAVGWIVGTLRRDRYRLPETRQQVPEWVTSATSDKQ